LSGSESVLTSVLPTWGARVGRNIFLAEHVGSCFETETNKGARLRKYESPTSRISMTTKCLNLKKHEKQREMQVAPEKKFSKFLVHVHC
jgi:hypothetical protein